MRAEEQTPASFICHVVACVRERSSPPSFLATCSRQKNWPQSYKSGRARLAAHWLQHTRVDPSPCLGKRVELVLVMWVSQPQGHEGRTGPTPGCLTHWVSYLGKYWKSHPGNEDKGDPIRLPIPLYLPTALAIYPNKIKFKRKTQNNQT